MSDHDRAAHHEAQDVCGARRLCARELLAEDGLLDQGRAAAAVLLGPRDACPAGRVELPLPLALELELDLIAAARRGTWVIVREPGAELVAERCLGLGQGEVHGRERIFDALREPAASSGIGLCRDIG